MIREHPRFQKTAIIFVSAVHLTDLDRLRGYESGAVDYVPVPVVPEILRAKVRVFAELYRKTRQLERLNRELEQRVAERTAELEASTAELRKSEERLRLAFDAAQMGWWDYDIVADQVTWSPSLVRIMGFAPESFGATLEGALDPRAPGGSRAIPDPRPRRLGRRIDSHSCELRFMRPDGTVRWSLAAGQVIRDAARQRGSASPASTSTSPSESRRRSASSCSCASSIIGPRTCWRSCSRCCISAVPSTMPEFIAAVDGRIQALSRAHTLLSETRWQGVDLGRIVEEEIAPFATGQSKQIAADGPAVSLTPPTAQSLALALHELVDECREVRRLSVPAGPRLARLGDRAAGSRRCAGSRRAGPPTQPADPAGLRHEGDRRRASSSSSAAARSSNGAGRPALHIDDPTQADRHDRAVRRGSRRNRATGATVAAIPMHRRQPHPCSWRTRPWSRC